MNHSNPVEKMPTPNPKKSRSVLVKMVVHRITILKNEVPEWKPRLEHLTKLHALFHGPVSDLASNWMKDRYGEEVERPLPEWRAHLRQLMVEKIVNAAVGVELFGAMVHRPSVRCEERLDCLMRLFYRDDLTDSILRDGFDMWLVDNVMAV